jgi:hypothetical protein
MIGHLDHILRKQAGYICRRRTLQLALQISLPAGQGETHLAKFACRRKRRRNGNRRTPIAAHGVDGNMERRRHGAQFADGWIGG